MALTHKKQDQLESLFASFASFPGIEPEPEKDKDTDQNQTKQKDQS